MRDFRDAKTMAQTLREALNAKSVSFTHSESLELIAKILGCRDWNALAAKIQASSGHRRRPTTAHPTKPRGRRSLWMRQFSTTMPASTSSATTPSLP
jgi:hypothetical protein